MNRLYLAARRCAVTLAGLGVVMFSYVAFAEAQEDIEWTDLVDQSAQIYDDPFIELSYDEIDDLRLIVRLRARMQRDDLTAEALTNLEARVAAKVSSLSQQGIDADGLIAQRRAVADRRARAASAGNAALDGATVKLAGFAIPAPADPDGSPVAYLVEVFGLCSHMPPPAPNQLVKIRLGGAWTPGRLYEPVVITGRLLIEPSERTMQLIDGLVPMRSTYVMYPEGVEVYSAPNNVASQTSYAAESWANHLINRLGGADAASEAGKANVP